MCPELWRVMTITAHSWMDHYQPMIPSRVNHRSALNDLDNFHVANGQLPQDIMHVLFEGVLPYELKLMLHQFIFVKMYFSLQYLNSQIGSFAYSAEETRDKPPSLKEHDFKTDGHISMKGLFNCIFF